MSGEGLITALKVLDLKRGYSLKSRARVVFDNAEDYVVTAGMKMRLSVDGLGQHTFTITPGTYTAESLASLLSNLVSDYWGVFYAHTEPSGKYLAAVSQKDPTVDTDEGSLVFENIDAETDAFYALIGLTINPPTSGKTIAESDYDPYVYVPRDREYAKLRLYATESKIAVAYFPYAFDGGVLTIETGVNDRLRLEIDGNISDVIFPAGEYMRERVDGYLDFINELNTQILDQTGYVALAQTLGVFGDVGIAIKSFHTGASAYVRFLDDAPGEDRIKSLLWDLKAGFEALPMTFYGQAGTDGYSPKYGDYYDGIVEYTDWEPAALRNVWGDHLHLDPNMSDQVGFQVSYDEGVKWKYVDHSTGGLFDARDEGGIQTWAGGGSWMAGDRLFAFGSPEPTVWMPILAGFVGKLRFRFKLFAGTDGAKLFDFRLGCEYHSFWFEDAIRSILKTASTHEFAGGRYEVTLQEDTNVLDLSDSHLANRLATVYNVFYPAHSTTTSVPFHWNPIAKTVTFTTTYLKDTTLFLEYTYTVKSHEVTSPYTEVAELPAILIKPGPIEKAAEWEQWAPTWDTGWENVEESGVRIGKQKAHYFSSPAIYRIPIRMEFLDDSNVQAKRMQSHFANWLTNNSIYSLDTGDEIGIQNLYTLDDAIVIAEESMGVALNFDMLVVNWDTEAEVADLIEEVKNEIYEIV